MKAYLKLNFKKQKVAKLLFNSVILTILRHVANFISVYSSIM